MNLRARTTGGRPAFTMIELILVMALLAIVAALASPSLSNFFKGRALDSEARRFMTLTRYAQSRAVTEGVPMLLWMDAEEGRYGLTMEPGYFEGSDDKAVEYSLAKNLTLEIPAGANQGLGQAQRAKLETGAALPLIRFQTDGFITPSSPDYVTIKEGGSNSVVIVQGRNKLHYEISLTGVPQVSALKNQ
jgi:prepilin-type N-terminal cleavage/methylation domain-containing protein